MKKLMLFPLFTSLFLQGMNDFKEDTHKHNMLNNGITWEYTRTKLTMLSRIGEQQSLQPQWYPTGFAAFDVCSKKLDSQGQVLPRTGSDLEGNLVVLHASTEFNTRRLVQEIKERTRRYGTAGLSVVTLLPVSNGNEQSHQIITHFSKEVADFHERLGAQITPPSSAGLYRIRYDFKNSHSTHE